MTQRGQQYERLEKNEMVYVRQINYTKDLRFRRFFGVAMDAIANPVLPALLLHSERSEKRVDFKKIYIFFK